MPRIKKLRPEFENGGILRNEFGQETARMTINGLLVINLAELFFEVERESFRHGWCPINKLNKTFGRAGTWSNDPSVIAALHELATLSIVEIGTNRVRPLMTTTKALKIIPKYISSVELLAGLDPLNG